MTTENTYHVELRDSAAEVIDQAAQMSGKSFEDLMGDFLENLAQQAGLDFDSEDISIGTTNAEDKTLTVYQEKEEGAQFKVDELSGGKRGTRVDWNESTGQVAVYGGEISTKNPTILITIRSLYEGQSGEPVPGDFTISVGDGNKTLLQQTLNTREGILSTHKMPTMGAVLTKTNDLVIGDINADNVDAKRAIAEEVDYSKIPVPEVSETVSIDRPKPAPRSPSSGPS